MPTVAIQRAFLFPTSLYSRATAKQRLQWCKEDKTSPPRQPTKERTTNNGKAFSEQHRNFQRTIPEHVVNDTGMPNKRHRKPAPNTEVMNTGQFTISVNSTHSVLWAFLTLKHFFCVFSHRIKAIRENLYTHKQRFFIKKS